MNTKTRERTIDGDLNPGNNSQMSMDWLRSGRPVFMLSRGLIILAIAILIAGCGGWDSKPGHYVKGTNAMAGVSSFIADYGWNSSTNVEDLWHWEDLTPHYVHGLPWSKLKDQDIQALTYDGILYVLSRPGWHHDYGGIAYNPQTNRFPTLDGFGFKPIGGHWYVWCLPELPGGSEFPHKYE